MQFSPFTLAYLPIGMAIQLVYLSLMESLLVPKYAHKAIKLIPAAVIALIAAFVSAHLAPMQRLLLNTAIYLAVPLLLYRGRILTKLLAFALWMVFYPCSESIALLLAPLWGWAHVATRPTDQLLFDLVCLLVTSVFYFALRSIKRILEDRPGRPLMLRLCGTAIAMVNCTFVILLNSMHNVGNILHPALQAALPYINAVGVFMPFFALHGLISLMHRLNSSIQETESLRAMEARAKRELTQIRAIAAKDERYRQLRHDFKNHLLALDALSRSGDTSRMREYIAALNITFDSSGQRVYCGNPIIDGLFESKALRMQQSDIAVTWRMRPAPESLPIDDLNLCALIGNALDNAIEACERQPAGENRTIAVSLDVGERGFFLQITNSCINAEALLPRIRTHSEKRRTGAGVGVASMQRIVDSNNGEMLFKAASPSSITLSIYLPA